jgi:hypothetical protein
MVEPLDFRSQQRERTTSWERADPAAALIETVAWNRWRVMLPGSTDPHAVHLEREHGAYVGGCDCPGFAHHDGPCAHLCTVRKADYGHFEDIRGRRIRIRSDAEERAGCFAEPDERLRADGGERR